MSVLIASLLLATVAAQLDYLNYNCRTCLSVGGRQCLQGGTMNYGTCCNPDTPYHQLSTFCKNQPQDQFCATKTSIKNEVLQDFVCPASTNYCPKGVEEYFVQVSEADKWYFREQLWHLNMPNPKATSWNCKYHIVADRSLVNSVISSLRGYLVVEVELYGFDEEVFVISTPYKKFHDFNATSPDASETRVMQAQFGSKFILPAEDEALISFAPVRNVGQNQGIISPSGKFRLRTRVIETFEEYVNDPLARILKYRAGEEPIVEPFPDPQNYTSEGNSTYPSTDEGGSGNSTNGTKVNWDGEVVPDGAWLDQTAFEFGDVVLTNEDLVVGSSATFVILMVLFAICVYISYRKRTRIAIEARRASEFLRRTSSAIRNSILGRGGSAELSEMPHRSRVVKQSSSSNKKHTDFLRDLFQHQDEMGVKEVEVSGLNQSKIEGRQNKIFRSATIIQGKQDKRNKDMKQFYKSLEDGSMADDTQKSDRDGFDIFLGGQYRPNDYEDPIIGESETKKRSKTMVISKKGKNKGLHRGDDGNGNFGADHGESKSENGNPFDSKDHTGMNMPSDVISFGNKTKEATQATQLANSKSMAALKEQRTDLNENGQMEFSKTLKTKKTVQFLSQTDGSSSRQDGEQEPRNFFADLKAHNGEDGMGMMHGLDKVNQILAGIEDDLEDQDVLKSIVMSQSIVHSTIDDLQRRDTQNSATKAQFFDLIKQSRNLLGDLRNIEQEKEAKLQGISHQISEEALPLDEDADQQARPYELNTIEEEKTNLNDSKAQSSNIHLDSQDLIGENDAEFSAFMKRKDTILTQITSLSKLRYGDDQEKQKQLVSQAEAALEEEKDAYLEVRKTIKRRESQRTGGHEEEDVQLFSGTMKIKEPEAAGGLNAAKQDSEAQQF